jgi:hypothetical protein
MELTHLGTGDSQSRLFFNPLRVSGRTPSTLEWGGFRQIHSLEHFNKSWIRTDLVESSLSLNRTSLCQHLLCMLLGSLEHRKKSIFSELFSHSLQAMILLWLDRLTSHEASQFLLRLHAAIQRLPIPGELH